MSLEWLDLRGCCFARIQRLVSHSMQSAETFCPGGYVVLFMRCEIWDHRFCCIVDEACVSISYMYLSHFCLSIQVLKGTDGHVRDTHTTRQKVPPISVYMSYTSLSQQAATSLTKLRSIACSIARRIARSLDQSIARSIARSVDRPIARSFA